MAVLQSLAANTYSPSLIDCGSCQLLRGCRAVHYKLGLLCTFDRWLIVNQTKVSWACAIPGWASPERCALSFVGTLSPPFSAHAVKRTWLPVWRKAWACACTTCLRSRCSTEVRSAAMVTWRRAKSATVASLRWVRGQDATSPLLLVLGSSLEASNVQRVEKVTFFSIKQKNKRANVNRYFISWKSRLSANEEHVKLWLRQHAAWVQNTHLQQTGSAHVHAAEWESSVDGMFMAEFRAAADVRVKEKKHGDLMSVSPRSRREYSALTRKSPHSCQKAGLCSNIQSLNWTRT